MADVVCAVYALSRRHRELQLIIRPGQYSHLKPVDQRSIGMTDRLWRASKMVNMSVCSSEDSLPTCRSRGLEVDDLAICSSFPVLMVQIWLCGGIVLLQEI